MASLFKIMCRGCGWKGWTRFQAPGLGHKCPKCMSSSLASGWGEVA